jgi:hypothetical protein
LAIEVVDGYRTIEQLDGEIARLDLEIEGCKRVLFWHQRKRRLRREVYEHRQKAEEQRTNYEAALANLERMKQENAGLGPAIDPSINLNQKMESEHGHTNFNQ